MRKATRTDVGLGPPKVRQRSRHPFLACSEKKACSRSIEDYEVELLVYFDKLQEFDRPNAQLIENQPEIDWYLRSRLVDFLLELHRVFGLSADVMFLAIQIMDRYSSKRIILKKHFQLVATTAFWIAAKFEDKATKLPRLPQLVAICSNRYDGYMFIQMESHILTTLNWKVKSCFTVFDAMELCFQHSDIIWPRTNVSFLKSVSIFFIELSCYDKNYMVFNSSIKAVSGIILASVLLNDNKFQLYISNLLLDFSRLIDRQNRVDELELICFPLLRLNKKSAENIRSCCLLYLNDIFKMLNPQRAISPVLLKKYEKCFIHSLISAYTSNNIETYIYLCKLTKGLVDKVYDKNVLLHSIHQITDRMLGLKLETDSKVALTVENLYGKNFASFDEYIVQTPTLKTDDSSRYYSKVQRNSSLYSTNTQSPMTPASLFSKSSISSISTEQDIEISQEPTGKTT